MKLIPILLLALMIQAHAAPDDPEKVCLEIEDLSHEEGSTIIHTKIPHINNQTNQKIKCYAACILEQINVMDGCSYQLGLGKQHAMDRGLSQLVMALDECKDSSTGSDRCDCGYNVFKCITDSLVASEGKAHSHE